jgi:glycosyltransferase involved in cell wall biosynthesis
MTGTSTGRSLPTVTAIVATHDRPELLRKTLDAIMAQDYAGPIECVVVFDQATPDESLQREGELRSIRTISNTRTPGLAGARNSGALAATGDWLAFCDDDDTWYSDKIRLQIELAIGRPTIDVVASGVTVSYEGQLTPRIPTESDVEFRPLLRSRATAAHPSSIVVRRSAFLNEIGLVDEQIPGSYGEDYDWLLRAARRGTVAVVSRPLVTVLWGRTSFFADHWATIIAAIRYLLGKHPEFASEPAGMARLYGRMAFAYAALGERGAARHWARMSLQHNWRERRAYVAMLVSLRLVGSGTALRIAHAAGKGI